MRFKVLRVCQSKGYSIVPQEVVRYDLAKAAEALEEQGYEVQPSDVMLIAYKDGLQCTLYVNGRMMFQPLEDKEYANVMAEGLYAALQKAREAL